ncbi:hypothetical protein ACM66B_000595 [Microbotryomycetes sp. NB124-2]
MPARARARAANSTPTKSRASSKDGSRPSKRRKTAADQQPSRRVAIRTPTRTARSHDGQLEDDRDDDDDEDEQLDEADDDDDEEEERPQEPQAGSSRFVTESLGDAYLLQANTTSKTSDKLLSDIFDQEFTYKSYADALQAFDDSPQLDTRRTAFATKLDKLAHTKFNSWLWELRQGFSVMLHGFGSKRAVLDRFAHDARSRGHVVVVKGYDPESSLVDIASAVEDILAEESRQTDQSSAGRRKAGKQSPSKGMAKAETVIPTSSLPSSTSVLESRFRKLVVALHNRPAKQAPIYLVVHNIDGPTLRLAKHLTLLALLSAQPSVHLITSVDHVRAGMLFSASMTMTRPHYLSANPTSFDSLFDVRSFNFVYHACQTFLPYTEEALVSNTLSKLLPSAVFPSLSSSLDSTSASLSQSALHVLASVTDRSRKVFQLLLKLQVDKFEEEEADQGKGSASEATERKKRVNLLPGQGQPAPLVAIKLDQFKTVATERLLAANQDQVDGLLAEFRDHNIVQGSQIAPVKGDDDDGDDAGDDEESGGEWIWVPMSKSVLENLLEQIESGAV